MKHPGGILVTRPLGQQAQLKERLQQEKIPAWLFPTIQITPIQPARSEIEQAMLGAHWLIFPSANAVDCGWEPIQPSISHFAHLAAVGKATAQKLKAVSQKEVIYPQTTQDSEGLLECEEFSHPEGQKIVIIKGEGGRATLKNELEKRGATVATINCYKRELPTPDLNLLDEALSHHPLVLSQSAEALNNLKTLAGDSLWHKLQQCPHVVTHPRIAEHAKSLNLKKVHLIENGSEPLLNLWRTLSD